MADRIRSDNPAIETVRASVSETATGVRLELPADEAASFPAGEVVRFVLDESERFGRIERGLSGDGLVVRGIYESPTHARNPRDGVDRFGDWVADVGVRTGGSVLVDVVEPDFLYGIRKPGQTAVYQAREPPADSLSEIAKNLEDG